MIKINEEVTFKNKEGRYVTGIVRKIKESGFVIVECQLHFMVNEKECKIVEKEESEEDWIWNNCK